MPKFILRVWAGLVLNKKQLDLLRDMRKEKSRKNAFGFCFFIKTLFRPEIGLMAADPFLAVADSQEEALAQEKVNEKAFECLLRGIHPRYIEAFLA